MRVHLAPSEISVARGVSGALLDIDGKVTIPILVGGLELIHTFYVLSC